MNWIYIHWVNAVFFCTVLGCFFLHIIHSSSSPAPTHPSEVGNIAVFCIFLSICWALSWGMAASTISVGTFICSGDLLGLSLYVIFAKFNLSKSFDSVRPLMMANWASLGLHSFSPAQHILTHYLCVFPYFVSSLIISANMSVSFRPWINCSFNCPSSSL